MGGLASGRNLGDDVTETGVLVMLPLPVVFVDSPM